MPSYLSPGVYVEEVEAGSRPIEGVGTAVAAFVGFAPQGPVNRPTLVTNWNQYTRHFGEYAEGCELAHAVQGYFLNGGGTCYVIRIGATDAEAGDGGHATGRSGRAAAQLPLGPSAVLGPYRVLTRDGLPAGGGDISVEVTDPPEGSGEDRFTLLVKRGGKVEETFENLTTKRIKDNVATVVREKSKLITIDETTPSGAPARPVSGEVALVEPKPSADAPVAAPTEISVDEYVGDTAARTGFSGLEAVDEVTMVAVPDLMGAYARGAIDLESVKAVQQAVIDHCDLMGDRMAILDPPPNLTPQQVKEWRTDIAGYDSKYAALYYPWIRIRDASTGTNRFVPPSGHVAGVWARSDNARGVHKAPANEVVRGALELATQLTRGEQEQLNPIGVNCIRAFPGRGIRVWGARTLSSDPAWRYLNVRRLFNYLEESILNGTQWVVFEPNDDALWARIRRTISAFLVMEWRRGALFGLTPDEAFFVRCDRETNSAESIDAGQVICEIGIAPVKPAEFVIFRLAQMSGGTSLVSE